MAETRVVRLKRGAPAGRLCDVRIDRRSMWGNPFIVGAPLPVPGLGRIMIHDRAQAVNWYWRWLAGDPMLKGFMEPERRNILARVHELKGRRLGCWCAPELCHGNILALLADGRLAIPEE